ncbi:MAG: serine/threonine protein kinase [Myxococcales bacterium]|nr:serine/threonine protein kinase [Myxococcales bacterium]
MECIVPPERADFGKYVLIGQLATGGMGEIFLARNRDPSSGDLLAIKRILGHHLSKQEYLNMFQSEARLASWLHHPNIIEIYELGQLNRTHYIAMEYVNGKSIRDIIERLRNRRIQMSLDHVVELAIQLCDGLAYAHMAKDQSGRHLRIIHRDINPHNVLVSYEGKLKIIDFGIAKSEVNPVHTATGTIKGKFVYMSPEQSAADPIDHRSDIFSLGIVIYELLTLENPFSRTNVVLSLEAIQRQPVVIPSGARKDSKALDDVLMRALNKAPEKRYQTATQMADALCALRESQTIPKADISLRRFLCDLFADDIYNEQKLLLQHWKRSSVRRLSSTSSLVQSEPDRARAMSTPTMRVRRLREPYASSKPTPSDELGAARERYTSRSGDYPPEHRRSLSFETNDSGHTSPHLSQSPSSLDCLEQSDGRDMARLEGSFDGGVFARAADRSNSHEARSSSVGPAGVMSSGPLGTRSPSQLGELPPEELMVRTDSSQLNSTYTPQPAAIVSPIYGHPGPAGETPSVFKQGVLIVLYAVIFTGITTMGYLVTSMLIKYWKVQL